MDQNIVVYASKTNWYSFYQADTSPKTVLTSYLIDILSKYDSIKACQNQSNYVEHQENGELQMCKLQ